MWQYIEIIQTICLFPPFLMQYKFTLYLFSFTYKNSWFNIYSPAFKLPYIHNGSVKTGLSKNVTFYDFCLRSHNLEEIFKKIQKDILRYI